MREEIRPDLEKRPVPSKLLRCIAAYVRPQPQPPLVLEDAAGHRLTRDEVIERAVDMVQCAHSHEDLARMYVNASTDADTLEWVVDHDDEFEDRE